MQRALVRFVKALRRAEVRVSPAETLDALQTLERVGYRDRTLLKNSLAAVLAKTAAEKAAFAECFERFFDSGGMRGEAPSGAGRSALGRQLLADDRAGLMLAMAQAASDVGLEGIVLFTQKGLYTQRIMDRMGLQALQAEIASEADPGLRDELLRRREGLRERVRDYVEQQFLLYADASGRQLREKLLYEAKLANLDPGYFDDLQRLVRRLAKRLAALHSRRRKRQRRGQLHMARTLRHNMAYDGRLFDLYWKRKRIQRPKVFALCDVSGSVSRYARFMLMFLYSLEDVMPNVRAFAFSSNLGEVSELFDQLTLRDALARTLRDYGGGATDYGQALLDFKRLCGDAVDQRSTIIVLGDARNNYGPHRAEVLESLYRRCKRLIWLNPEPPAFWRIGDAEMRRYAAYCHRVEQCHSLRHLERVIGRLLNTA